ncbi:MAG: hypothetical protein KME35_11595 [Aphanocapsa sp. GSE-SYN-MK-11-07L]|jgi:predicted nuclease with TOPRIM domain|nr:hypothetical protein [Aphanocapsa sp. GSE-SYN-MK-11-07L]
MTQATDALEVLKRLDKLTTNIESLQSGIQEIKISQARTEEQIKSVQQQIIDLDKSLNKRIDTLETRGNSQENRFWSLVAILATALLGILGKIVFFPVGKI